MTLRADTARPFSLRQPFSEAPAVPRLGSCLCFLCGHESGIPLPLAQDQSNWIECERCGFDNEIPAGTVMGDALPGQAPTYTI